MKNIASLAVLLMALGGCASGPTEHTLEGVHPNVKNVYYPSEKRYIVLTDKDGFSEKIEFPGCAEPRFCGDLVNIVCDVDSASEYFNNVTGKHVQSCGGDCKPGSSAKQEECKAKCPPQEWTCG